MSREPSRATVTVVPANQVDFADVQAVLGARGAASRCQCQRYKLARGESFAGTPVEERRHRLRDQTACGDPLSTVTSGLVAVRDDGPVGWCAVEPRPSYQGLRRQRVPWGGSAEDPDDASVWALTCVLLRAGCRKQGVSRMLVDAAVRFARDRGARRIEAYPMTTAAAVDEELHVGMLTTFLAAGFTEVTRPSLRRAVVRFDLGGAGGSGQRPAGVRP